MIFYQVKIDRAKDRMIYLVVMTMVISMFYSCNNVGNKTSNQTEQEPTLEIYNTEIASKLSEFIEQTVKYKDKITYYTMIYLTKNSKGKTILTFYYTTPFECDDFIGAGKYNGKTIMIYSNLKKEESENWLKLKNSKMDCNTVAKIREIDLPVQRYYEFENGNVIEPEYDDEGFKKLGLIPFINKDIISWKSGDGESNTSNLLSVAKLESTAGLKELLDNDNFNTVGTRRNWSISKWNKTPFRNKDVLQLALNVNSLDKANSKFRKEIDEVKKELNVEGNYVFYYYKEKKGQLYAVDLYLVAINQKKIYKIEVVKEGAANILNE